MSSTKKDFLAKETLILLGLKGTDFFIGSQISNNNV